MTRIIFLGLLGAMTMCLTGHAQNVDSLINVLETQKLSVEEQFNLYKAITELYLQNDLGKYKTYTDKGLELATKKGNKEMLATFNLRLGVFYDYKASYDTAIICYEKAVKLAQEVRNKNIEAKAYTNMATLYGSKGEYTTLIEYDLKALSIFETLKDKKSLIGLLVNMGAVYISLSDYKRALYYLDWANKLAEEINYTLGKLHIYQNYAAVYHNKAVTCDSLNNEEYNKALEYYLKAYEISKKENDKYNEMSSTNNMALIYLEYYKDFDKAEKYALESLQMAEKFGDPSSISKSSYVLAYIYSEQKRYKYCDIFATNAWKMDSLNINTNTSLMEELIISNIHLNNKEKAEHFFNKYIELNNEKVKKDLQETLIGMDAKYQTEKKEIHIASLEKERQLYVWLGVAGMLLAIVLGIVLWQKIKNAREEKQLIATRSILEGEMKERKRLAQDLHDRLSGNLSAVKLELNKNTGISQNISDQLDKCIDDIRDTAHDLMPSSLQLGMKPALEDFAAQFPNVKFHFFGEEKRIKEQIEFTVYCCASELVNNSLKHSDAKNIHLQLVQHEKNIMLTVSDDGCGFDEKAITKDFGLKSIRDRVVSCGGKIDIVTSPGSGTETTIELRITD